MTPGGVIIILVFALFIWGLTTVMRITHDNFTRRQLAESGTSADVIRALYTHPTDVELASLRGGLVASGAGAAFVTLQFLPFGLRDPAAWGIVLLAVGVALIAYQVILPHALARLYRRTA